MYLLVILGNFHALILFQNEDELLKVNGVVHRLVERAIALDGTCEYFVLAYTNLLCNGSLNFKIST